MKKSLIILLTILIVLIVAGLLYYFLWYLKPAENVQITDSTIETKPESVTINGDWQTYNGPLLPIYFKYPATYDLVEVEDDELIETEMRSKVVIFGPGKIDFNEHLYSYFPHHYQMMKKGTTDSVASDEGVVEVHEVTINGQKLKIEERECSSAASGSNDKEATCLKTEIPIPGGADENDAYLFFGQDYFKGYDKIDGFMDEYQRILVTLKI